MSTSSSTRMPCPDGAWDVRPATSPHRPRLHGDVVRLRADRRQRSRCACCTATSSAAATFSTPRKSTGRTTTRSLLGRFLTESRRATASSSRRSSASSSTRRPSDHAASTARRRTSARSATRASRASASSTIDLFYQHRVDPQVPIEDVDRRRWPSWSAPARSARSVCRRLDRRRCAARTRCIRVAALQTEYSLWTRESRRTACSRPAASSGSGSCRTARSGAGS